jgi:hypothetical protein
MRRLPSGGVLNMAGMAAFPLRNVSRARARVTSLMAAPAIPAITQNELGVLRPPDGGSGARASHP